MRHEFQMAKIIIVAGLFLLLLLISMFIFEPTITGRYSESGTTLNVTPSEPANCSFTAYTGLNLISLSCTTTAESVLRFWNGSYSGVWATYQYIPGSADPWKVFNPNLPSYVINDLQFTSRRVGYVAVMNSTRTINFTGSIPVSTSVPVIRGWQLVGYPSLAVKNASETLGLINTSITEARTYNNSQGIYESYIPFVGGTLNLTVPGEGYWINGTSLTSWGLTAS